MVIRLKNSRKFAVILMAAVIFISSLVMVNSYAEFRKNEEAIQADMQEMVLTNRAEDLALGANYLYNEIYAGTTQLELTDYFDADDFLILKKYMDYELFDEDGKAVLGDAGKAVAEKLLETETDYAFRATFELINGGELKEVKVDGSVLDKRSAYDMEERLAYFCNEKEVYLGGASETDGEQTVVFGLTEEQLDSYMKENWDNNYQYAHQLAHDATFLRYEWTLLLVIAVVSVLAALNKGWRVHELKIFNAPLEIVGIAWLFLLERQTSIAGMVWNAMNGNSGGEMLVNFGVWLAVFAVVCWGAVCLTEILTLKKAYWTERTLCARIFRRRGNSGGTDGISTDGIGTGDGTGGDIEKTGAQKVAGLIQKVWKQLKDALKKTYDEFLHMNFQDKSNKMILKALIINFILLLLITCMWFYGIFALVLYSVLLYVILRKYSSDIRKKYELLLEATNLLAEGNLDVPIDGDFGIFNPMKTEIKKIQKGFKKAVQEEVKSERMKTELITNVSHDLKTPLTAIITYVDLLKSEENPEKRKEYLEVLEKKSLRLKVLIEDLFEISKATSKNVTMNFMQVDIVGLLKQVGLECDGKIKDANLDFRWNLPESKVVMLLDSQKTYRIFENLIVNITKYAMPHTRVYVDLTDEESHVLISMKNVSAAELNFNSDEITDRFVRGDASRNTEGSGLGLAIAKSFTELQFGTLKVSTDADLFKVVIRLPKRSVAEPETDTEIKTEK